MTRQKKQERLQEPDARAECDLLHAIIMQPDLATIIVKQIRADYFYHPERRKIASSLIALDARGESLTDAWIKSELIDVNNQDAVAEVTSIITGASSHANVEWQANLDRVKRIYSAISGEPCPEPARMAAEKTRKPKASWVWMSDVKPVEIQWLWFNRIPLGMVTQFAGNGGLGKSYVSLDIAARITNGSQWPDHESGYAPQGNVIILNAEDNVENTIRPRLDKLGADSSKIAYLNAIKTGDKERPFSLSSDLEP